MKAHKFNCPNRKLLRCAFCFVALLFSCASFDTTHYENPIDDNFHDANTVCNFPSPKRYNIVYSDTARKYDHSVKEHNYSKIIYGDKDTAVLLLHGFISSPFEVFFLGREINRHGYTVLMPLIEGFGGSTEFANRTKYSAWQETSEQSLEELGRCYSKIVVVGFSLGGAIITDYLLNNSTENTKIQGVVLLAPYYSTSISGGKFINNVVDLFTDSISLKTLYRFSANEDLKIPLSNPDYYNSEMPLKAIKEIMKFAEKIRSTPGRHLPIPLQTLLIYSEDDRTVDNNVSIKFVREHFNNVTTIQYEKAKEIRHQLSVPKGNAEFEELCASVVAFIGRTCR